MRSARFVLRCAAGVLLAATVACSFTTGFDGFVGPEKTEDAPVSTADGEPIAPPSDGGTSRGLDVEVADLDAGRGGDAPDPNVPPVFLDGGSYCEQTGSGASFCEDFDTHELPAAWLTEGVFGKLTSYLARSSPNVFLVDVPPSTAGGTFVSKITRNFEDASTDMIFGFDFRPEQTNVGSSVLILAAVEWTRAEDKYSLRLVYSSGSVRLEESNLVPPPDNTDAYHPFFGIPTDRWSRVTLDIAASGPSPGVQIYLDGVAVGVREPIKPTSNIDRRPTVILGAVYAANPHTGWVLRYDDVTLNFR